MSGLWKCACQKGKERTRRPAPIPTSVGRLGHSLATRCSANVASASPSRSDDTRDCVGSQAPLPEALHAFFTSAALRRALFASSVCAPSCRSILQSDEPEIDYVNDYVDDGVGRAGAAGLPPPRWLAEFSPHIGGPGGILH